VAVIAIDAKSNVLLTTSVAGSGTIIGGTAQANRSDRLTKYSGGLPRSEGILAKAPWIYSPRLVGMWAEAYMMLAQFSDPGDSGAPVLIDGTDRLAGHVVGASPGFTSYVQEADYQLRVAGWKLLSSTQQVGSTP
jgi:hypothetical protein